MSVALRRSIQREIGCSERLQGNPRVGFLGNLASFVETIKFAEAGQLLALAATHHFDQICRTDDKIYWLLHRRLLHFTSIESALLAIIDETGEAINETHCRLIHWPPLDLREAIDGCSNEIETEIHQVLQAPKISAKKSKTKRLTVSRPALKNSAAICRCSSSNPTPLSPSFCSSCLASKRGSCCENTIQALWDFHEDEPTANFVDKIVVPGDVVLDLCSMTNQTIELGGGLRQKPLPQYGQDDYGNGAGAGAGAGENSNEDEFGRSPEQHFSH
ncbi:hypothetical protein WN943_006414 [Citrus x changshan-huyou]